MFAARDIGVGEEVCVSYLDDEGLGLCLKRREGLLRNWFGGCWCGRCRGERGEGDDGDGGDDGNGGGHGDGDRCPSRCIVT